MSDRDELEETLALVARGVQRMADSFGTVEQRLAELDRLEAISDRIDEYRVRSRTELQQVADRIARLEAVLAERAEREHGADGERAGDLADVVGALRGELAEHRTALARGAGPTGSAEVGRLVDAVRALRDDLAAATAQIEARIVEAPAPPPPPASTVEVDVDRLVDAVRALRDDLAAATTDLQAETTATVERAANEQGTRLAQLRDAIIALRDAIPVELPAPPPPDDREVRALVAEVRDALQSVHGEIVAGSGQLRTDLAAEQATLRDRVVEAVAALPAPVVAEERLAAIEAAVSSLGPPDLSSIERALAALAERPAAPIDRVDVQARFDAIDAALVAVRHDIAAATAPPDGPDPLEPRLQAIEASVAQLRDDLAIDRIESSMRVMGGELERVSSGTIDLRDDVRRSFERVLSSISTAEQHVVGEVKAIDHRLGGMAEDLRLVRGLRDGLEALAGGVDAVRQLASRSATSQQMAELGRDLTGLLAELESARSQVLAVDQHVAGQPQAIDVRPAIQRLERSVGVDVDELGKRIEQLAAAVESKRDEQPDLSDAIADRLRTLATGARQLGMGISEDLRSRRRRKPAQQR